MTVSHNSSQLLVQHVLDSLLSSVGQLKCHQILGRHHQQFSHKAWLPTRSYYAQGLLCCHVSAHTPGLTVFVALANRTSLSGCAQEGFHGPYRNSIVLQSERMDRCPQPPWGWPKSRINGASCNLQTTTTNDSLLNLSQESCKC